MGGKQGERTTHGGSTRGGCREKDNPRRVVGQHPWVCIHLGGGGVGVCPDPWGAHMVGGHGGCSPLASSSCFFLRPQVLW